MLSADNICDLKLGLILERWSWVGVQVVATIYSQAFSGRSLKENPQFYLIKPPLFICSSILRLSSRHFSQRIRLYNAAWQLLGMAQMTPKGLPAGYSISYLAFHDTLYVWPWYDFFCLLEPVFLNTSLLCRLSPMDFSFPIVFALFFACNAVSSSRYASLTLENCFSLTDLKAVHRAWSCLCHWMRKF